MKTFRDCDLLAEECLGPYLWWGFFVIFFFAKNSIINVIGSKYASVTLESDFSGTSEISTILWNRIVVSTSFNFMRKVNSLLANVPILYPRKITRKPNVF